MLHIFVIHNEISLILLEHVTSYCVVQGYVFFTLDFLEHFKSICEELALNVLEHVISQDNN